MHRKVAKETGMGSRINSILQTCFFAISNVIPKEEAINILRKAFANPMEEKVKLLFRKILMQLIKHWRIFSN